MADRSTAHIARLLLATALLLPALLLPALLLPLWAQAQSAQLYQVELLVFSQPGGAGAEHWDPLPELAYPRPSRFLTYPGEQPSRAATSIPDAPTAVSPGSTLSAPLQTTPYATLPSEQRQLSGKAAAMQRSGRYHILFHEAWIQPMDSQAEALPIVLDRSGDGGAWPELQGTIKLYQSRYLYLETNLWLNTQGGYLQSGWRMPAPPLAPMSSARESTAYTGSVGAGHVGAVAAGNPSYQPAVAGAQSAAAIDNNVRAADYPYRHAVLLKQTQRMRSGDIVYVDHPLLGVLIRISPLAAPGVAPTPAPSASAPPTAAAPIQ